MALSAHTSWCLSPHTPHTEGASWMGSAEELLHSPCCGCCHRCWDHPLSRVSAHAPAIGQYCLWVSLVMEHTSRCSSPNPHKDRAPLICVWGSPWVSYVCSQVSPTSCPLVPAVFFFLLWFSYSPIPWLCPQILRFSQSQLKIFLRTSLSTRQQPTQRSWEPLAAKGRLWLVQLWEERHCPSRSSPLHPWRAHRKVQAMWPRDSPD